MESGKTVIAVMVLVALAALVIWFVVGKFMDGDEKAKLEEKKIHVANSRVGTVGSNAMWPLTDIYAQGDPNVIGTAAALYDIYGAPTQPMKKYGAAEGPGGCEKLCKSVDGANCSMYYYRDATTDPSKPTGVCYSIDPALISALGEVGNKNPTGDFTGPITDKQKAQILMGVYAPTYPKMLPPNTAITLPSDVGYYPKGYNALTDARKHVVMSGIGYNDKYLWPRVNIYGEAESGTLAANPQYRGVMQKVSEYAYMMMPAAEDMHSAAARDLRDCGKVCASTPACSKKGIYYFRDETTDPKAPTGTCYY